MIKKLVSLFFPPRCPFCANVLPPHLSICDDCLENLPYIEDNSCEICGKELGEFSHKICSECKGEKRYFIKSFVPLKYSSLSKRAIVRMKYYHHPSYAKAFAILIAEKFLKDAGEDISFDLITYFPQNKLTALVRGFNQSELIANHLSEIFNIPCKGTLIRTNDGVRQATLNKRERRENVRKCYFKGDVEINGNVFLVDDVYTTGATANYCARLLKSMGAKKVYLGVAALRCEE